MGNNELDSYVTDANLIDLISVAHNIDKDSFPHPILSVLNRLIDDMLVEKIVQFYSSDLEKIHQVISNLKSTSKHHEILETLKYIMK